MGEVFDASGPQRLVAGGIWFLVLMVLSGVFWWLWSVVLSRTYGPYGYGIFSTASSLFNFAWAFIFGGLFEGFIKYGSEHIARKGWKLRSYFSTALTYMTILGVLMFLLFSAASFYIEDFITKTMLLSIALAFLFSGTKDALASIIGSFQKSNYLSILQSSRAIIVLLAGVIYIVAGFPAYVLPSLIVVATLWQLLLSSYMLRTRLRKLIPFDLGGIFHKKKFQTSGNLHQFIEIFIFGFFISLGIISFNVMKSLDIVVLTLFFDYSGVGIYSVADTAASTLFYMTSFALPIIPAIAEAYANRDQDLLEEYGKIAIKYPVIIGIPLTLIIFTMAEPLILVIYGEAFAQAVEPLRILIVGTFMLMLGYTLSSILIGVGKAKKAGLLMLAAAVQYILSLFILVPLFGFIGAAFSLTLTGFTSMLLIPYYIKKEIGISIYSGLYKVFIAAFIMFIVLYFIPKSEFIFILLGIAAGIALFLILLRTMRYLTGEDFAMIKGVGTSFKE